jgi:uncharacterized membrane protein YeaQ/YmgE (transglycosylase-associated protein family)
MNIVWFLLIGFAASKLSQRFLKNRCYSRFDDFLLGALGALLGSACAEEFGLTGYGISLFVAVAGAGFLLLLTGMVAQDNRARETVGGLLLMKLPPTQTNVVSDSVADIQEAPQVSRAA